MEEKVKARLAELHEAERKTELELIVIRNLIAELDRLLAPIITEGEE